MTTTTLTWASSGNGTKTGTGIANYFDNLDTLITSKSGDATFSWQKAGKLSTGSTTQWLLLSRKDGSAGRIAIIYYVATPAFGNAAIFDTTPSADVLYIAFFPAGTGATLSNLTAASGTMCGTDTGSVKAGSGYSLSTFYATSMVHFYFDSYDGLYFLTCDPSNTPAYCVAAGALLEDTLTATAVNATFGSSAFSMNILSTAALGAWTSSVPNAGNPFQGWWANYPSSTVSKPYFQAWTTSGTWSTQLPTTTTDIMSDVTNSKYFYAAVPLLGQTKGEGIVLKPRQFGFGSGTASPFVVYYTTGPVAQARQMSNATAGATNSPWLTNFKI